MTVISDQPKIKGIRDIPGWFPWMDQQVFSHFLRSQKDSPKGDLVELGVFKGKSAALIGRHLRRGETFTVCDLFEDEAEGMNRQENERHYKGLNRAQFEQNYLALHDVLPIVVQGASETIMRHVDPGSVRFVHIDASHLYEHVVTDIDSAREMLRSDGVVVFDDYRSVHTPGVSAAVWEAVFCKGLAPICVTKQKLYGTFGDPAPHHARLLEWLRGESGLRVEVQQVGGRPLARIHYPRQPRGAGAVPADVQQSLQKLSKEVHALARSVDVVLEQRPMARAQRALVRARRGVLAQRVRR